MGIRDVLNASSIKRENEKLLSLLNEMGAGDSISVRTTIDRLRGEAEKIASENKLLKDEYSKLAAALDQKKSQLIVLDEELMLEDFALYKPKFSFSSSTEYKHRLDVVRLQQKEMIKSGSAAFGNQDWRVNNNRAQGRKMVRDVIKLVVRSFNNECDYCVDHVTFNNVEKSVQRIEKSFSLLNNLASVMQVGMNPTYKNLKLEELYLAHEYQEKKQDEKEELKRLREEVREQQKLDEEIKQARAKIAKEKSHFTAALEALRFRLSSAVDKAEHNVVEERIQEIEWQMKKLDSEEKTIDYREQNAKAGYVYIISNIGAFGEGVYKIGMTRRLEPKDRIYELGDASVPFEFDLHALVFSDNAKLLESKLHEHFHSNRINKINNRKEFFRADINEVEKVVKANYDKALDLVKTAAAEQYRESLVLGSQLGRNLQKHN